MKENGGLASNMSMRQKIALEVLLKIIETEGRVGASKSPTADKYTPVDEQGVPVVNPTPMAKLAYQFADAMIAEGKV